MTMEAALHPPRPRDAAGVHSASLQERYAQYRRAQGRELLNVIPREGVRTLLRHFRAGEEGGPEGAAGESLLEWLAGRCCEILPLPPLEIWAREFHAARRSFAHVPGAPLAPEAPDGTPVTVDVRSVPYRDREWIAALALRSRDDHWIGHIRFHASEEEMAYATGDVFREASPMAIRKRFQSFDERTLEAFLRSALP